MFARCASVVLIACTVNIALVGTDARAAGGPTIADAPPLAYGVLVSGGGTKAEYYRMALYGGDRIVFLYDRPSGVCGTFQLFAPDVTDFTIRDATPALEKIAPDGKSQIVWTSPYQGDAVLRIASLYGCPTVVSPYTMQVDVEHSTVITFGPVPGQARPAARFALTARVQSPAGVPAGTCNFRQVVGKHSRALGSVPLTDGSCQMRVSTARRGKARYRVSFVPDSGWLKSSKLTSAVRSRR